MPQISCAGRKWLFASDDLFYPGIVELILNTAWLAAMVLVFSLDSPDSPECLLNRGLVAYYSVMIAALSATELLIAAIVFLSSQGTIMNDAPRRLVGPLLIIRLIFRLAEGFVGVYGAFFLFAPAFSLERSSCAHAKSVMVMARISCIVSYFAVVSSLVAIGVVYDSLGRARLQGDKRRVEEHARKIYRERMSCCLLICGEKPTDSMDRSRVEAFSSIAEYLAEYFESDDLAASDVLAALILLAKQHRATGVSGVRHARPPLGVSISCTSTAAHIQAVLKAHGVTDWPPPAAIHSRSGTSFLYDSSDDLHSNLHSENTCHGRNRTLDWLDLRVLQRVLRFAAGIYGWPFYALKHNAFDVTFSLLPNLHCCNTCRCCRCLSFNDSDERNANVDTVGDNCCECNLSAFLLETEMRREDVLFASWLELGIHRVSYSVLLDHTLHSVLIVIRGTMSIGDVLTDIGFDLTRLTAPSDSFQDFLDAPNHHPFFQSSNAAYNCCSAESDDAQSHDEVDSGGRQVYFVHSGMLHAAMRLRRSIEERALLETAFSRYPHYNLVVTGHSLGAGVSALLGWSYAASACNVASPLPSNGESHSALRTAMSKVVCYAFSPPGGLVSKTASQHMARFVCSPFFGDDVIPRTGLSPLNLLKNEMLVVLHECSVPKHRVIAKGCWQLCCTDVTVPESDVELTDGNVRSGYQRVRTADSLSSGESDKQSSSRAVEEPLITARHADGLLLTKARQLATERAREQQHLKVVHYPSMYAPGILMHLTAEHVTDEHDSTNRVTYRLAVRQCDDLQRMVISTQMIANHVPVDLQTALNCLVQLVEQAERSGLQTSAS